MSDVDLLLFGLKLCKQILKMTDNMSKTLQNGSLSAAMAQHIASLIVTTLSKMRTDEAFQTFFDLIGFLHTLAGVEQPSLPRKIDDSNGGDYFSEQLKNTIACSTLKQ